MPPVLSLGFSLPGSRGATVPLMPIDVLVAQLAGACELGAGLGLEDDLGDSVTVAKVDEQQAAEVAPGVDPAVEHDILPDVLGGQVTASLSAFVEHDSAIGRQVVSTSLLRSITIPPSDENRQAIKDSDTTSLHVVRNLGTGRGAGDPGILHLAATKSSGHGHEQSYGHVSQ